MTPHPLLDQIAALYFRDGYPFADADREIERMRLAFEWASGQWVMLSDKATDRLWAWASWWRVSRELLDDIRDGKIEEHVLHGHPTELLGGPCVYISTVVVAPYAPAGTYRRIWELVAAANDDAATISGHIRRRGGTVQWVERDYQEGRACLSARTSSPARAAAPR